MSHWCLAGAKVLINKEESIAYVRWIRGTFNYWCGLYDVLLVATAQR
jgi:hypothetical protein